MSEERSSVMIHVAEMQQHSSQHFSVTRYKSKSMLIALFFAFSQYSSRISRIEKECGEQNSSSVGKDNKILQFWLLSSAVGHLISQE